MLAKVLSSTHWRQRKCATLPQSLERLRWRLDLEKLESRWTIASCESYASFVHSNLPRASITRRTHVYYEPIVNFKLPSSPFEPAKCTTTLDSDNQLCVVTKSMIFSASPSGMAVRDTNEANLSDWLPWRGVSQWWFRYWHYTQGCGK